MNTWTIIKYTRAGMREGAQRPTYWAYETIDGLPGRKLGPAHSYAGALGLVVRNTGGVPITDPITSAEAHDYR